MGAFKQYLMRAYRAIDGSYYTWVAGEYDSDLSEGNPPHTAGEYSDFQVVGRVPVDYAGLTLSESGGNVAWDLHDGVVATLTLEGAWTLSNPTNMEANRTYLLFVVQDGTGGHTLAFDTDYVWPGGTAPTISPGAGAVDVISFLSDGTAMYGVYSQNFS